MSHESFGPPASIKLEGDRMIIIFTPPPPPQLEIPLQGVACQGYDFSGTFSLKCIEGECMIKTENNRSHKIPLELLEFADKKLAAAAEEACFQLQKKAGAK